MLLDQICILTLLFETIQREWAGRGRDKRDLRRDRFSPPHDGSPPRMKRMRRDWFVHQFI